MEDRRLLSAAPTAFLPGGPLAGLVDTFLHRLPWPIAGGGSSTNTITNGGFENVPPDLTGWTAIGNASLRDASYYTPPQGAYQAALSNGNAATGSADSVAASQVETFLNLTSGTLSNQGAGAAVDGSAIKQSFDGRRGDILTFKADFLTNETDGKTDFGFVTLTSDTGVTTVIKLRDPLHATSATVLGATTLVSETGYHTYTLVLPKNGHYTLGFGVVNTGTDNFGLSNLLVDQVKVTHNPFCFLGFWFGRDNGNWNNVT